MLHFVTFFLLTVLFYWILDTNRRRTLNLTLLVCTACLGVGSEFLQGLLPNGRVFDLYDIAANVFGSLAAVGLCTWYHKRMLERRRQARGYGAVPGEAEGDLEMGEANPGAAAGQEEGIVESAGAAVAQDAGRGRTLEEEVDNWDENAADDWDEEENGTATKTKGKREEDAGDIGDAKKRSD